VTSRRKRNIFYQSGLRLCGQETAEEVVANHLGYFHLRVCQETVWEAFKIFWDRLPEQDEYQSWMSRCQEGTVAVQDIGSYFSQSEEHQALVKEVSMYSTDFMNGALETWSFINANFTPTPASSETVEAPDLDVISPEVEESPVSTQRYCFYCCASQMYKLFNEITIQPTAAPVLEQVVELSILLTGEVFSDELRDPASLKFQTLSRDLAEKIEDALEGLPGFKSVSVIDFRLDGIVVDYAVTVAVDGAGVSSEQLNYLTLQSNLVENSYREIKEPPTVVYTISGIKNIFTEPHHIDELFPLKALFSTLDKYFLKHLRVIEDPAVLSDNSGFIYSLHLLFAELESRGLQPQEGPPAAIVSKTLPFFLIRPDITTFSYSPASETLWKNAYNIVTCIHQHSTIRALLTSETYGSTVSEIPEPVRAADEATTSPVQPADELPWTDEFANENRSNKGIMTGNPIRLPPHLTPFEVLTLDHPTGGGSSPPVELNTLGPEEDIVILEESELASPEAALATSPPEAGSIEEEDLLPEDAVLAPAPETIPPKELLPEPPSQETPKSSTLPEPPIETEASGSGRENLDSLIEPSIEEEDQISLVETEDVKSEPEQEKVDEVEILEKPEVSTVLTKTTIEQGQPALLPPTETVNIPTEASEPDVAKTTLHSDVDEPVVQAPEDSSKFGKDPDQDVEEETPFTVISSIVPDFDALPDKAITSLRTQLSDSSVPMRRFTWSTQSLVTFTWIGTQGSKTRNCPNHHTASNILPSSLSTSWFHRLHRTSIVTSFESYTSLYIEKYASCTFTLVSLEKKLQLFQFFKMHMASIRSQIFKTFFCLDHGYDLIPYDYGLTNQTEEGSTGSPFSVAQGTDQVSIAMPINPRRALIVFFSLRVTNMVFSEDLFNKSSPEYKALEQRFLELLVPYLQSNLSHFENLEILNFRNGSIVVNSRMKFGRPVARGVTTTVYLILEDFCNTAYQTMNLAIDKYSLDVESGDQADPCKFQACNEYAECKVNKWSGEAECVCNAGYFSVDGLPCQSICELQTDFCLNDGKCDIIPGQGAICRCRVGENWWYRGEHCEEYVSEPLVVGIAIASVAGFLFVASGVLFFLARTLRDQYDKEESEDPVRRVESLPSLERATKYNPMYESEATTGYSHYYRRYPEAPTYSSASAEASTDFSSEEIRHIYENSELTKEEIQDRIRIIELYAKDRQFADFVRQHQAVLDTQRESSSMHS
uniref:Interphotoreceptor matrix proteoglycan 2 n=1 Tax=Poecilia formosa TaxID=48698 RepID=A0A087YGG2_POEFO